MNRMTEKRLKLFEYMLLEHAPRAVELSDEIRACWKERDELREFREFVMNETWQVMVSANDVFAWACADTQTFNTQRLDEIIKINKKYPKAGLVAIMACIRDRHPQEPLYKYIGKEEYLKARNEVDALQKQFTEEAPYKHSENGFGFVDVYEADYKKHADTINKLKEQNAALEVRVRELEATNYGSAQGHNKDIRDE